MKIWRTGADTSVLKVFAGFLLALIFSLTVSQMIYAQQIQQGIADKVIRFHVLANSDEAEDQQLKLKVRDAVGTMMEKRLAGAESLEKSREMIQNSLGDIEKCALKVIRENGYDYEVEAKLTDCRFPEKDYGEASFPAGEYEALEVLIGAGEGHNWWCVMYPNLCFSGSVYEVDDEASHRQLQEVLTSEEYKTVMEGKDYKVRFKFLTFLNDIFEQK